MLQTLHFEDTPYLCRYFRQRTGMSPMEYREPCIV
ncbi:MAG: AraC family transcriptional regulator [Bacteroidaceae bacterium]|nr:AraC family transcriptional regulator [Bacteroidaceae bacterium]